MKIRHRITALLSCAAVLFVSSAGLPGNAALFTSEPVGTAQLAGATYGSMTYTSQGGYIEITDCNTSVTSIEIPSQIGGVPVKSIGKQAFYGCSKLKTVTIPDSVTSIGDEVFSGCGAMTSVRMPVRVTSFGDGVFQYCTSLMDVKLPLGLSQVNTCTFYQCTSLQTVAIPATVKSVGNWAFNNCKSLRTVEFGGTQA
ncbi:MAG: leucine-rich repeat domain-containing protein, partial [Oscillospiraceae bacterium]|nr:leucine-rich repeat domain-containing protein [Oscillospiraceae bacterium]